MDNMMRSLSKLLKDNASTLGIPADCIYLISSPNQTVDDTHRRSITVRELRTQEAPANEVPLGGETSAWTGEIEVFRTIFEVLVECRPMRADRESDYYWNEARLLAEKVRAFFRGAGGAGRYVDRIAWEKAGTPAEGQGVVVWQRTDPQPEVPEDPARVRVMTFEMVWWAPAPTP